MYSGVYVLFWVIPLSRTIKWEIETENIVIGKDVTLTCNGSTCSSDRIKKWIGGPDYGLLCYEDKSVKPSKYEMIDDKTSQNFSLKIKNVSIIDINCKYTCACGLQQYTNSIDLDLFPPIQPPNIIQNSNYKTENGYVVNTVIEVDPLPTCFIEYQMIFIQVNYTIVSNALAVFNESTSRMSTSFKLRIQHTVRKMETNSCGGTLHLLCEVVGVNYTVINANITMCKDESSTIETMVNVDPVIVCLVTVICAVLVLVTCAVYNVTKRKNRRREQNKYAGVMMIIEHVDG